MLLSYVLSGLVEIRELQAALERGGFNPGPLSDVVNPRIAGAVARFALALSRVITSIPEVPGVMRDAVKKVVDLDDFFMRSTRIDLPILKIGPHGIADIVENAGGIKATLRTGADLLQGAGLADAASALRKVADAVDGASSEVRSLIESHAGAIKTAIDLYLLAYPRKPGLFVKRVREVVERAIAPMEVPSVSTIERRAIVSPPSVREALQVFDPGKDLWMIATPTVTPLRGWGADLAAADYAITSSPTRDPAAREVTPEEFEKETGHKISRPFPWLWVGGGVAAATILGLLLFWRPRREQV